MWGGIEQKLCVYKTMERGWGRRLSLCQVVFVKRWSLEVQEIEKYLHPLLGSLPQSRWLLQPAQYSSFDGYWLAPTPCQAQGGRGEQGSVHVLGIARWSPRGGWDASCQREGGDGQQGRARETDITYYSNSTFHLSGKRFGWGYPPMRGVLQRSERSDIHSVQKTWLLLSSPMTFIFNVRCVWKESGWGWKSFCLWNVVFWGQSIESWLLTTSHKTVIFGVAS